MRRNWFYQCAANHCNPYRLVPSLQHLPPPACPHCGVELTEELMQKEAKEWDDVDDDARKDIQRVYSKTHRGGQRGQEPVVRMDQASRAPSILHMRRCASTGRPAGGGEGGG